MSSQIRQDPLVGLVINPGVYTIVVPSADELRALGTKWIRYLLTHSTQNYDTGQNGELDLVIERYQALGVNILALINPETINENPPLNNPARWGDANSGYISRVAAITQKIAAYYRGKIAAIEVFNEPDNQNILPADYARLLVPVYDKIKAVSDVPVISAGICCGQNHAYLQSVIQAAQGKFDAVGWHPYGLSVEGYPSATWGYGDLRDSIVRARAIAGKPLWLTEIGAELGYSWTQNPADAVAEYLNRAYDLVRALGTDTVARAFWYTYQNSTEGWGLVDNSYNHRPAWHALQAQVQFTSATPTPPTITQVTFTPHQVKPGELLNVSFTIKNNSDQTLGTQGPDPGFVYEEGETVYSRNFAETRGAFRVGVDFEDRIGVDHPYRWGLGAPLPPGETCTVTGAIRLKSAQSKKYWAGLVQEQMAWLVDRQGEQMIQVDAPASGKPQIVEASLSPKTLASGDMLNFSITVQNNTTQTLATQAPDPGFVYNEGDTFYTRNFPEVPGAFRVAIDFDDRTGVDHPYRWGLGAPLAPGETRTITGAIRLKNAQSKNYWAGLVQEQIAWLQDRQGMTPVNVTTPAGGAPRIVGVAFWPTTLAQGDVLNVTVTVENAGGETLVTQGPEPGFVYEEGDTFFTRNFPDVQGAFRVGIDFDGHAGIDHPYRWGLGAPLAPGNRVAVRGSIHLTTAQSRNFWAGLVREQIAWLEDQKGTQAITVQVPSDAKPEVSSVTISPDTLMPNDSLRVSITVKNTTNQSLTTQGPDPSLVYEEGDTFYSRGFADVPGAYRVGVDFNRRSGISHPYRWGLASPLAPGESRTITGSIRLKTPQSQDFWAGLVDEQIAWLRDRAGVQVITVAPAMAKSRVVHVFDPSVTTWNGEPDYWNYVNQAVVNQMVERGVINLTGKPNTADAWRSILPRYQAGQGIAIKVNCTNEGNGRLDASIQTINAIVRGLRAIDVRADDVWVYDTRTMPDRFINGCQFPGVKFFDNGLHAPTAFDSTDPSALIPFSTPPSGIPALPPIKVTDVLLNATYLINLPLFKAHLTGAGVTLGFKNHLGTTSIPSAFHAYIWPNAAYFRSDYNPLIDLMKSPHIGPKTVLTIGEGLFAGNVWNSPPLALKTFGNKPPSSLFFAQDPVALDSVMYNFIDAEWDLPAGSDYYLRLASSLGMGVYERGDPWGGGYKKIDYQKI